MGRPSGSDSSGSNRPTDTTNACLWMVAGHQLFDFADAGAGHIDREYYLTVRKGDAHLAQVDMWHLDRKALTENDRGDCRHAGDNRPSRRAQV